MEDGVAQPLRTFELPKKADRRNVQKRSIVILLITLFGVAAVTLGGFQVYWHVENCSNDTSSTWSTHKVQGCTVYVRTQTEANGGSGTSPDEEEQWQPIKDAHVASFEEINELYGKDKNGVYFEAQTIPDASSTTFSLLTGPYSADHKSVFWNGRPIRGAIPKEFVVSVQIPDIGSQSHRLFYRDQEVRLAERSRVASLVTPTETYPLTTNEPTLVRWEAATDTYPFVLIHLAGRKDSQWLTSEPYPNTGTFIFSLEEDGVEGGDYALRILLLPNDDETPLLLLNERAYAFENPWVRFAINGLHPEPPRYWITARPGEELELSWDTGGVRDCTLSHDLYRTVESGKQSTTVRVKDYKEWGGSASISYGITCTSYGGRSLRDQVQVSVLGWDYRDPIELALKTPNGGEVFQAGDSMNVTWDGAASNTNVRLILFRNSEYSPTDDKNYEYVHELARATANSGSFTWTIPPGLPAEADYFIRLDCSYDPKLQCFSDDSDTSFSIGLSREDALARMDERKLQDVAETGHIEGAVWTSINSYLFTDGTSVYVDAGLGKLEKLPDYLDEAVKPADIRIIDDKVVTMHKMAYHHQCYSNKDCTLTYVHESNSESFEKINEIYYKDADNVFVFVRSQNYPGRIDLWPIKSADPRTFEVIEGYFGRDALHVYYVDTLIEGADPDTFSPSNAANFEDATTYKDKHRTYKKTLVSPSHIYEVQQYKILPS